MENAYIYTRVSTLIQVDGFSLEAQEAEIRAFAEARKINIVGKYTDEAVIIGLKPPSTNGRRFSPISITGHFPI